MCYNPSSTEWVPVLLILKISDTEDWNISISGFYKIFAFLFNNGYVKVTLNDIELLPPMEEEVFFRPHALARLSVCQKRMHGFGWNIACRQMSGMHELTD